ncbi:MAG: 4-phosphoerythronate dehydrogenase [Balneolaceae bacterium]|nr:4-phosphoerythronate dehydrogenase [Balneolaceae bacterium]MBO6547647.1 4-phosphoerythronate dehydrogenase [Balneolaceae bacterium]MBO6648158.1 4-phosphoerythronate dehydrogenase [Balneolaceae bacterium]
MIKVIADQNLYRLQEFLPNEVELTSYDPHQGLPDTNGFDALLIRTVSKLNHQTFPEIPESLRFVGTGSSGIDHVDTDYLKSNNIEFADALGNNSRAVAEYVMTALLLWREEKSKNLADFSCGIVGVGNAGSVVAEIFGDFGLKTVLYDPPRAEREPGFNSASLDEVLNCDVITFHVPFSDAGKYPTKHWLNEEKMITRSFELIINAARGGVIDEFAVSKAMDSGQVKDIVIDVWENEPDFDAEFANRAFIATPHIAGYSEQSKLNASSMICEKLCHFFGLKCPLTENLYQVKEIKPAHIKYSLIDWLLRLHPIKEYDAVLRDLAQRQDKDILFQKLRTDRPYRFEYSFLKLEEKFLKGFDDLKRLGVKRK